MAYLEEIPVYKNAFLQALIDNQNIVTFLGNTGESVTQPADLIGVNIHPTPYIPDTPDAVMTYICFDVYVPKVKDRFYKDVQMIINIFSHKNQAPLNGKSRVDLLNIEVDKLLNGNMDYGIDAVELVSVLPYIPNNTYYGKQMIYNIPDFNQRRCRHHEHTL